MSFPDFDSAAFLRDHWQKKPLLIRNPWSAWTNPLDPDELAGLACEEEVEARLIEQKGGNWTLEHGPFAAKRFAKLGKTPWTLLVQGVDQHVPDVAALIDPFRFVPNWRIDDVMVSYASDGGGVGPHFDQYDVFLVQGLGKRRWRVGPLCDDTTPLMPHEDLRLLADFPATDEWVLEPGDILYVPPGFGHDGVAVGEDCMTYSIGFRAPSRKDLIEGYALHLIEEAREDDRYADPDLMAQDNPGEITPAALARLHDMLSAAVTDRDSFARWFGGYNSAPKYPDLDFRPEEPVSAEEVREELCEAATLSRNPASRLSFIRREEGGLWLFVDGESFLCEGASAALAERLCAESSFAPGPQTAAVDEAVSLITALINQGSLMFEAEED